MTVTLIARNRPREDETFAKLCALTHQLGPGRRLPRHAELLVELGVSKRTLDAALGRLEAMQLIQRFQGRGIYTAEARGREVAVLVDPEQVRLAQYSQFWDMFLAQLVEEGRSRANDYGLHFALPGKYDESAVQDGLRQEVLQGKLKVVLCVGVPEAITNWLEEHGVRVVAYATNAQTVVAGDVEWMVDWGVRRLAEQGCQRIELWSPLPWRHPQSEPYSVSHASLAAFRGALTELNLHESAARGTRLWPGQRLKESASRPGYYETDERDEEQGFRRVHETFQVTGPVPDGIVSLNDQMTHGALVAFEQLGIAVGKDVRLVSHANRGSRVLSGFRADFDLLEFDSQEIVTALFQVVQRVLDLEAEPAGVVRIRPVPVVRTALLDE